MANLRNDSKGGFESGLTWLRVRHSTAELPHLSWLTINISKIRVTIGSNIIYWIFTCTVKKAWLLLSTNSRLFVPRFKINIGSRSISICAALTLWLIMWSRQIRQCHFVVMSKPKFCLTYPPYFPSIFTTWFSKWICRCSMLFILMCHCILIFWRIRRNISFLYHIC